MVDVSVIGTNGIDATTSTCPVEQQPLFSPSTFNETNFFNPTRFPEQENTINPLFSIDCTNASK
jgi:hypothetical protein